MERGKRQIAADGQSTNVHHTHTQTHTQITLPLVVQVESRKKKIFFGGVFEKKTIITRRVDLNEI